MLTEAKCGLLGLLGEVKTPSGILPEDIIGLDSIEGIQIVENDSNSGFRIIRQTLQQDDIESWIKNTDVVSEQTANKLRARILMGWQVVSNDRLRPPADAQAVRFSRSKFATSFQLPLIAIQKVASHSLWQMRFSARDDSKLSVCEGLGSCSLSFASSQTPGSRICQVFVVSHSIETIQTVLDSLEHVSDTPFDPAMINFILGNTAVRKFTYMIDAHLSRIAQNDLHLLRLATQRDAKSMFGSAHISSNSLDHIEQDIGNVQKLVQSTCASMEQRRLGISQGSEQCGSVQSQLALGLNHLSNELDSMRENVSSGRNESVRQVSTALNMMVYGQQELTREDQKTSIAIAEASKMIAEETKRDGSSMKTLALVTMFFLPATAVSSVFSMSFFNWQAHNDVVVDSRIWIFFALSVPLTVLTLSVWWAWQRQLLRRSNLGTSTKAEAVHEQMV